MLELFKIRRKDYFKRPVFLMTIKGLYIKLYRSDATVLNIKTNKIRTTSLSLAKKSYLSVSNIAVSGVFFSNIKDYKKALKIVRNGETTI